MPLVRIYSVVLDKKMKICKVDAVATKQKRNTNIGIGLLQEIFDFEFDTVVALHFSPRRLRPPLVRPGFARPNIAFAETVCAEVCAYM